MKNIFSDFKKKSKNLSFFLIFLGFLISVAIILSCFYFNKEIKKVADFPDFSLQKTKEAASSVEEFRIEIDKINVSAPVILNVNGADRNIYNKELQKGVAHLKGTALPGQGSNIFIFGHSSSEIGWGKYAKVFARLNELQYKDYIMIFYNGKEYRYSVFDKEIVQKNKVDVISSTEEEQLTLMTCWPIGTADKRLIIKSQLLE